LHAIFVGYESSGNWCREILTNIQQHTPHTWPSHTLALFPQVLADFYKQNTVPREDRNALKRSVEAEHRRWKSKIVVLFNELLMVAFQVWPVKVISSITSPHKGSRGCPLFSFGKILLHLIRFT
jgi:hypothetical protein